MEYNASLLETNVTLQQIASALNFNISNSTNQSDVSEKLFGIYDDYRAKEREQLHIYKSVAYVLGTLIILSNLTVVISSGLILKKGQQPKSTYLLLGNVSLADTIIGIAIIFGTAADNTISTNMLCIFQIGMVACPTMVSIFSVGLIAIDRYIYILHGLYYQRWINATRVRIGIVIIWLVGVTLGFMPLTGWINVPLGDLRCRYSSIFPRELVLFNSAISLIPILVVVVLYSIILRRALKNMIAIQREKDMANPNNPATSEKPKLRAYRGNYNNNKTLNHNYATNIQDKNIKKSIIKCSSSGDLRSSKDNKEECLTIKCKSISEIHLDKYSEDNEAKQNNTVESDISVWTVETASSHSVPSTRSVSLKQRKTCFINRLLHSGRKRNEPCKCKSAILMVLMTTGTFVFTWLPFFIFVIKYMLACDYTNMLSAQCKSYSRALAGPVSSVAFINCIMNPLIYAWFHKGYQKAVKQYIDRYCTKKYYEKMFRRGM